MTDNINQMIINAHLGTKSGYQAAFNRELSTNMGNMNDLAVNAVLSRQNFLEKLADPRRDINKECGYPETASIQIEQYKELYDRLGPAAKVVDLEPEESWKEYPVVYETEDVDNTTAFEQALEDVCKELAGGSFLQEENKSSPLWNYCARADRISGIGHYGIMVLGINDGGSLKDPIQSVESAVTKYKTPIFNEEIKRKLMYIRVADEDIAKINTYETDKKNPRYGLPTEYRVQMQDPAKGNSAGVGRDFSHIEIHWTRVIHIADGLDSSEVFAIPRQQQVLNNLLNLVKLYGGSAEMYWQGAFPGLTIETHPSLGGKVQIDKDAAREQLQDYMHSLQRWIAIGGASVKTLAPQVVDPTPQIERQIEAICIRKGIPKRIFIGSERGELSSGQDKDSWEEKVIKRRNDYVKPRIIVPLIDRLILAGVLPKPKDGYVVEWPEREMSPMESADLAVKKTEAMSKYVAGGVQDLMPPKQFFVRILGMSQEEADEILEEAVDYINESNPDEEDVTVPGKSPKPKELTEDSDENEEDEDDKEEEDKDPPSEKKESGKKEEGDEGGKGKGPAANELIENEEVIVFDKITLITANNCGVGSGGFQPGNTCARGGGGGATAKSDVGGSGEGGSIGAGDTVRLGKGMKNPKNKHLEGKEVTVTTVKKNGNLIVEYEGKKYHVAAKKVDGKTGNAPKKPAKKKAAKKVSKKVAKKATKKVAKKAAKKKSRKVAPPPKTITADRARAYAKKHGVDVWGVKASPEVAHEIAHGIYQLKKNGQPLPKRIHVNGSNQAAMAFYSSARPGQITINDGRNRGLSTMARVRMAAKEGWLASASPGATVVHEVGHMLHYERGGFIGQSHFRRGNRKHTGIGGGGKRLAGEVSRYAQTLKVEFVAEMYAAKIVDGKKFSEAAEEYYRQLGGPEV